MFFVIHGKNNNIRSGGFVVTNKIELYKKIKKIKNNGISNVLEVEKWGNLGFNFKYTDFISSITPSELKI